MARFSMIVFTFLAFAGQLAYASKNVATSPAGAKAVRLCSSYAKSTYQHPHTSRVYAEKLDGAGNSNAGYAVFIRFTQRAMLNCIIGADGSLQNAQLDENCYTITNLEQYAFGNFKSCDSAPLLYEKSTL